MADHTERWLPIPGYDGYEASNLGRIRSWKPWRSTPVPRVLKWYLNTSGYPVVGITRNGERQRDHKVHRLVTETFLGPLPLGLETRHLDGDKTNNVLSNLVYGTTSENQRDRIRHGNHHFANRTHCVNGHPYDELNTWRYAKTGERVCRACRREKARLQFGYTKVKRSKYQRPPE